MRLIVYSVILTYVDDILSGELDNIFPTKESAIAAAKKIGMLKSGVSDGETVSVRTLTGTARELRSYAITFPLMS